MDDPAVRLRLLVGDDDVRARITPATPSIVTPPIVTPPIVVRLLLDDGRVRAQIGEAPATPSIDTPPVVTPPIVVRLLLDDDGCVRAQIGEAPPALPPPLDPETERRLDAFSAKRWDAVRRPAPPPRVKTEAERRLESFNDEHWDEWRARTTATPRPPLSTHGGNEVWRRDAHAPPPRDAECTFAPRVHARPVRPRVARPAAVPPEVAALRAQRRAARFATRPTPVEQLGPAFNTSGRNWAPHVPRSRPHLAEPNMVRRVARAWEQMDI